MSSEKNSSNDLSLPAIKYAKNFAHNDCLLSSVQTVIAAAARICKYFRKSALTRFQVVLYVCLGSRREVG